MAKQGAAGDHFSYDRRPARAGPARGSSNLHNLQSRPSTQQTLAPRVCSINLQVVK